MCCLFVATSGNGRLNQNCSYIQNPGFPSAVADAATALTYTVTRCSNGQWIGWTLIQLYVVRVCTIAEVCSLRLDFESSTLTGVGGTAEVDEGECTTDTFSINVSGAIKAFAFIPECVEKM